MINILNIKRIAALTAVAAATLLVAGMLTEISAQRDPFQKPSFMRKRTPPNGSSSSSTPPPKVPMPAPNYGPPAVEARIDYFKQLRETAVANGSPLPKVTSVLTLAEMAVTGIFKTPRGYAAMVEATPIKLSYTIYPGEKFFDGQLVAVEENRLVFRKVSKVGEGKFVASVENKPLKKYTNKAQIEGTAPTQPTENPVEIAANTAPPPVAKDNKTPKTTSNPFLSPLDEMNKQPADSPKTEKPKKGAKKPDVKLANNRDN
ncbi:MAG: hypothetical protein ABR530_07270 [Pyrinomonadaceae bacterium]